MTHELAALYEQRKQQWCCLTVAQREHVRKRYDELLKTHPAIPAFCVAVAEVLHEVRQAEQIAAAIRAGAGSHAYH